MTAPAKPVLLTGATGNLGRHLAAALAQQGWRPFPIRCPPVHPS